MERWLLVCLPNASSGIDLAGIFNLIKPTLQFAVELYKTCFSLISNDTKVKKTSLFKHW